jgi:transcriptional regulator with XRE-family HTH domain
MSIRRGELTERRLARLTGISQPHMHHLIKGARDLTPSTADIIINALDVELTDLLDTAELAEELEWRPRPGENSREVPVLSQRLGPGIRLPLAESPFERLSLPAELLVGIRNPVAARLAADSRMEPLIAAGDMILLNFDEIDRANPKPEHMYLVNTAGGLVIRWVRLGTRHLYLVPADVFDQPKAWDVIPLNGSPAHSIVVGRVMPLAHLAPAYPAGARPRSPGTCQAPAQHSVAS